MTASVWASVGSVWAPASRRTAASRPLPARTTARLPGGSFVLLRGGADDPGADDLEVRDALAVDGVLCGCSGIPSVDSQPAVGGEAAGYLAAERDLDRTRVGRAAAH